MTATPLPIAQQWGLVSMQVVNWGCFDGYHTVDFAAPREVTLITGATGAGKSTLLDAHIVLMHDPKTALNRASNASRHRSRSSETRNVVAYMRGVIGQTRDVDGEHDVMLRDGTVWSGIAETWRSTDGAVLTAISVFFSTAQDTTRPTLRRDAWVADEFDLRWLEPFVSGEHVDAPLPPRSLERTFPGLTVMPSTSSLHKVLWRRLGIGREGDGVKAMALLYKVQSADAVESVNDLFTTFVLDRPRTYDRADEAIEHFEKLRDSHTKMRTIEEQTRRLSRIPDVWDRYTTAADDLQFFTTLNATMEPTDTPFWKWRRDREYTALDEAETAATLEFTAASRIAASDQELVEQRTREWQQVATAVEDDANLKLLPQLEVSIAAAEQERDRVEEYRADVERAVGPTLTLPRTRAAYERQRTASQAARTGQSRLLEEAEKAHDEAQRQLWRLGDERGTLREQLRHYTGRGNVTDPAHDRIRQRYADIVGLDPAQLPYVGELLDVAVDYEPWRMAAEKALGGLARTLLVAARDLANFRRFADAEPTNRRIPYLTVVDLDLPVQEADPATIAGRLQYREHPYSGWLSRRVKSTANHLCVNSPEELAHLPAGYSDAVTINGQTANRDGGIVGGQVGHRHTIGFSAAVVLTELESRLANNAELEKPAQQEQERTRAVVESIKTQLDAHRRLLDTPWPRIDIELAERHLTDLIGRRDALAADPTAKELLAQRAQADTNLTAAHTDASTSKIKAQQLDSIRGDIATRKDRAWSHFTELDAVPDPDMDRLDQLLAEHRDGPGGTGRAGADDFTETAWRPFVRALAAQYTAAESARAEARDRLVQTFEEYLAAYPDPTVDTNPDLYYPHFRGILDRHATSGVAGAKAEFTEYATEYGGHELTALTLAYQDERDAIAARLGEINAALAAQPYGSTETGRIRIVSRDGHVHNKVTSFRTALHEATSGATTVLTHQEALTKFETFDALITQLADPQQRDLLLDVRRHILLEAQHRDSDALVAFHRDLGAKSGGETQELTMFIIAAAIRYRVGSLDASTPRFAPVFMDEGLIKADPERTRRAVNVWTHLGFQPIIATTADKHESISRTASVLVSISKDAAERSRIDVAHALTPPRPDPQ